MDFQWLQFIIVCPLVFLAGFVDSIAGGGGLISLPAYILSGLPIHTAIATNKMSSSMGTTIATVRFYRSGLISVRKVLPCILAAVFGAVAGANLSLIIPERIFQWIMLFLVPLTAFHVLRVNPGQLNESSDGNMELLPAMLITFAMGVYDGMYGPGTGTFLLVLFTGLLGMSLIESNGIAKSVNLTTNLISLAIFLLHGAVCLPLGLTAGLFSIAGNYLGARVFMSGGQRIVKPALLIVLLLLFFKLVTEII